MILLPITYNFSIFFFWCHLARMPFTPGVVPAGVNRRPRSVGKTAINLQLYSDATSRAS